MTNCTFVGDAVDFIRGITFAPDQCIAIDADDAVVCMRTKNVQRDLDVSDLIAVPRSIIRNPDKLLRKGDILISSANSWELVGKCTFVRDLDYPATAGGFIGIVRPKKGRTHPRFFYHWLNSPRTQHAVRNLGRQTTNIANLDVKRFKELPLPKLNFSEQERIAAILDRADNVRRKHEQIIDATKDFVRSAYLHTVGHLNPNHSQWTPFTIEALAAGRKGAIRSGPFGSALRHGEFVDDGIAVLGIDNAVQNKFVWAERRYVTHAKYEELRRYKVFPGDVIITIMGTTGRSAVVPDDIPEAITTKHLATITCNRELIHPEVLSFAIHSDPLIIRQIKSHNKGAIMDGLNLGMIRQLEINLPPMEEQLRFISMLQKSRAIEGKSLTPDGSGEDLFQSLSQRAFRSEL
jgi:type I restriction enzyme S subunit